MTNPASEALYNAVVENDWKTANALIAEGAVPDKKTLKFSLRSRTLTWTEMLLKSGAKPASELLSYVLMDHAVAWAELLIRAGATPTATTLHYTVAANKFDKAKALVAGGVVPDGRTLEFAEKYKRPEWTDLLLNAIVADEAASKQPPEEVRDVVKQMRRQVAKKPVHPGP